MSRDTPRPTSAMCVIPRGRSLVLLLRFQDAINGLLCWVGILIQSFLEIVALVVRLVLVSSAADHSFIDEEKETDDAAILDDNGSGSVMILEVLRVLLSDPKIASGDILNTLEFHWYGAEEAGLLGSQDIFTQYRASSRQVVSMLQQDMVGYVGRDGVERFGVVTDWVDLDQVAFMKRVIDTVSY